jgi:hypothetical protein
MYGTVMIATLRGSRGEVEAALSEWLTSRAPQVRGFVDAGLLIGDDGTTLVNWARFESREDYQRLGDDPAQDEWYRTRIEPLLDGEPRWIDGSWLLVGESVRA